MSLFEQAVLCEKPLGLNLADVQEMVDKARWSISWFSCRWQKISLLAMIKMMRIIQQMSKLWWTMLCITTIPDICHVKKIQIGCTIFTFYILEEKLYIFEAKNVHFSIFFENLVCGKKVQRMIIIREKGVFFMEAVWSRTFPVYKEISNKLETLGNPVNVVMTFGQKVSMMMMISKRLAIVWSLN